MCKHVCKYVHFLIQKAFIRLLGLHVSFHPVNNIGLYLSLFYSKIPWSQYEGISFKSDDLYSLANNKVGKMTEYLIRNSFLQFQLLKLPKKLRFKFSGVVLIQKRFFAKAPKKVVVHLL